MSINRPFSLIGRTALISLALVGVIGLGACKKATPEEKLAEAVKLLQEGQTARAVLKMRDLVKASPKDPAAGEAHLMLAQYYARQSDAPKALEELEAVYASLPLSDPRTQNAIDGIVAIRIQIKDYEKALAFLDEVYAKEPDSSPITKNSRLMDKAEVLFVWGEPGKVEEGVAILDKLMLESPDPQTRGLAREKLANNYKMDREFEKSIDVYRRYLAKYPEDTLKPSLELAMAVNYNELGKKEESKALFEPAIAELTKRADAELDREKKNQILNEISTWHESVGDYEKAEAVMKRIMAENNMSRVAIDTQFQIGRMYCMAGIKQNTLETFERGVAVFEQIKTENKGSSIEQLADERINGARQGWKLYQESLAKVAAAADGSSTDTLKTATPTAS